MLVVSNIFIYLHLSISNKSSRAKIVCKQKQLFSIGSVFSHQMSPPFVINMTSVIIFIFI